MSPAYAARAEIYSKTCQFVSYVADVIAEMHAFARISTQCHKDDVGKRKRAIAQARINLIAAPADLLRVAPVGGHIV